MKKQNRTEYLRQYKLKNRDRIREVSKRYEKKNVKIYRERSKIWREANREKTRASDKKYRQRRPDIKAAGCSKWRAKKLQATPIWANAKVIKIFYKLAKLLTELTGIKYHVDHVIPLRNKLVCGLHVEHNLQIITAKENMSKSNRFWPDMPD